MKRTTYRSSDNTAMVLHYWEASRPTAVVQLLHGMNDHSARFDTLGTFLSTHDITVYADDHRGHGLSATAEERGHIADENGWRLLLDDQYLLTEYIQNRHPQTPIFLLGHSMGSFIVRTMIGEHHTPYSGAILTGVAHFSLIEMQGYEMALKSSGSLFGPKYRSDTLFRIGLKGMNRREKEVESGYEWLSADKNIGITFAKDPLNPKSNTMAFIRDLLTLMEKMQDPELIRNIPKDFPLLIYSGTMDPVGKYGDSLKKIEKLYRSAGLRNIDTRLLDGIRHEPHNEPNNEAWMTELVEWIQRWSN